MTKSDRNPVRRKNPKNQKRKRRSPALLIGSISAVALVAGGAAGYFMLTRSPKGNGIHNIATVIPQEAHVVIAFNTKPENWQKLNQFDTPGSKKLFGTVMQQSPLSILEQSKTDFSKDVQPWLGGNTITALVPNPQKPNSQPGTLILASTNDSSQSDAFLIKYRDGLTKQKAKFVAKQYKGLNYYEALTKEPGRSVITASIDGKYVAIATSADLIQQTYDTYKGEKPSLATKPNFSSVFGANGNSNLSDPIAQIYLDGSIALGYISKEAKVNLSTPVLAESRKQLDAITLAVGTQKEGIRMELSIYAKSDSNTQNERANDSQNGTNAIISKLPQEAFLLISGSNLNQSWKEISAQSKSNPGSEQAAKQLRQAVKDSTQLDLEKDILKWMNGEFAIAAIPSNEGLLKNFGFGLVVVMQTSDRTATSSMLKKLDDLAQSSDSGVIPQGVEIKTKQLGGQKISIWEVGGKSSVASHGFIDDKYAFWAMGNLSEMFVPQSSKNLSESSAFQTLTTALPKNNGGYFYLDMSTALSIADRLIPNEAKTGQTYTEAQTILDGILGIAVTNSSLDNRITRLDFLFTLKPTPGK